MPCLCLVSLGTDLHNHQAFAGFVTETWFNSKNTDDTVVIAGYTLIRRDRLKRKGGGVCVEICDRVYINRDLTKAQSQAAYELRCRRRAAAAQRRSKQGDQPTSLSAAAKPFTPSDDN